MATLPSTSVTSVSTVLDDEFMETFFEIRADAEDNILTSNVVSALLKTKGVYEPQTGGQKIERTIKYGTAQNASVVNRGSTLPIGVPQLETGAFWGFERYFAAVVQRNTLQDTVNAGPLKIKDYVTKRLEAAMDSMKDMYEASWLRAHDSSEALGYPQGLCDIVPPPATRATGNWGSIARPTTYSSNVPTVGNTWWSPRYAELTLPIDVNLLSDIRSFHQVVTDQMEAPDTILMSRTLYNMFMDFGLEATQIMYNERVLDLGFKVLKWDGAELTWVPAMAASATLKDGTTAGYAGLTHAILFLNTKRMRVMYNPLVYFQATPWESIPREFTRLMYILCQQTCISDQPRRHGLLYQT